MRLLQKKDKSMIKPRLILTFTIIAITALSGFIISLDEKDSFSFSTPKASDMPEIPVLGNPGSPNTNGSVYLTWSSNILTSEYSVYKYTSWITEINTSVIWIANTTNNYITNPEYINRIWYYVVRAANASGNSEISNCVSVQIQLPIGPVLNVVGDQNNTGRLEFSWTSIANTVNYTLLRCETPISDVNSSVTSIATVTGTSFIYYCKSPTNFYYAIYANTTSRRTLISNNVHETIDVFDMAKHNSVSVSTDLSFVDYVSYDPIEDECLFQQRTYVLTATFTFSRYNNHQIRINYTTTNTHGKSGTYWEQTVSVITSQQTLTQTASSYSWIIEDDYYFKFEISGVYWGYKYATGNCPAVTLYPGTAPKRSTEVIIERPPNKPVLISKNLSRESSGSVKMEYVLGMPNNNWNLTHSNRPITNIIMYISKNNATYEARELSLIGIELPGNQLSHYCLFDSEDANYSYYFSIFYDRQVPQNSTVYYVEVTGFSDTYTGNDGSWPDYLIWIVVGPILGISVMVGVIVFKAKRQFKDAVHKSQPNIPVMNKTTPNKPIPVSNAPTTYKPTPPVQKEYDPFADNAKKSGDSDNGWN